ncbi:MAG: four-carbon acid sugar kinase family protein, partial [Verrucomicrobia bacterium]|nr:four-carbon acid sugar kinase family protein [Verrucomicrobiota bacterium]
MPPTASALLLAYYGDDFTGSADVLEALATAGLRAALFLQAPSAAQLARYPGLRAFGIAGGSRTLSVATMNRELPAAFAALRDSGARIVHYKLCSTFDSSPGIGSIGRAIELGREVFGSQPTPLVVGLPLLGRYVAFGNLFARSGLDSEPHRLDRHPTMSRHPVTPMDESDLRRVLARQTSLPVTLGDAIALEAALEHSGGPIPPALAAAGSGDILLFDTLRDAHLTVIGHALEHLAERRGPPLFVAGSSAVEYALAAHWATAGHSPPVFHPPPDRAQTPSSGPVRGPVVVVSGSCSPVTGRQIA